MKVAFPLATTVRPATLFGHEDRFLNWHAWMGERLRMPLCEDGSALVQVCVCIDWVCVFFFTRRKTLNAFGGVCGCVTQLCVCMYALSRLLPRLASLPLALSRLARACQPVWVGDVARAIMLVAEEDPLEEESKVV